MSLQLPTLLSAAMPRRPESSIPAPVVVLSVAETTALIGFLAQGTPANYHYYKIPLTEAL